MKQTILIVHLDPCLLMPRTLFAVHLALCSSLLLVAWATFLWGHLLRVHMSLDSLRVCSDGGMF